VIETGGVQNAASNIALASIAPQALIAIKGQNLATSTEVPMVSRCPPHWAASR